MKVYGDRKSGNCYKVQLMFALLQRNYEWIDVNILAGDTRTESFLGKNPAAKIPLLELDYGEYISESNAIINYLAYHSKYYPQDGLNHAKVLQWQFFEQYSHEPNIAVARFINLYLGLPENRKAEYLAKQEGGHKALAVMEQQLAKTNFLVGDSMTTADVSLFAYTHVAHEGGFDLGRYPSILLWIDRIKHHPFYVPMG